MKTTWRRIILATTCASLLSLSAFAATASGGGGGSNGTVHISEVDDAKGNDPHVGCEFTLEFSGFDEGTGSITSIAIVDRDADEDDAPVWASTAPWTIEDDGTAEVPVTIVAGGRSATRTHVELVATVLEEDVEVPMKSKVFWLSCGDVVVDDTIIDDGGDDVIIDDVIIDDVIIDDVIIDDVIIDDGRDPTVEGVVITGSSPQPVFTDAAAPAIETPAAPVTPIAPSSAIDSGRPAAALPASYLDQGRPAVALPALARTGTDTRGLAALGASLMLLGAALVAVTLRWQVLLVGDVS